MLIKACVFTKDYLDKFYPGEGIAMRLTELLKGKGVWDRTTGEFPRELGYVKEAWINEDGAVIAFLDIEDSEPLASYVVGSEAFEAVSIA